MILDAVQRLKIYLCAFFLCLSSIAYGWGPMGHSAVAMIAAEHLTPAAQRHVAYILHGHSMAEVSSWPDHLRGNKAPAARKTLPWHYATFPEAHHYQLPDSLNRGDVYTAMRMCQHMLQQGLVGNASADEQYWALTFLIHLVGDAHQPLHVGNGTDLGANRCFVKWFGRKRLVSLHQVWDSLLLKKLYKTPQQLVDHIDQQALAHEERWEQVDMMQWLEESREAHDHVYPGPQQAPWQRPYCQVQYHVPTEVPHLTRAYVDAHRALIERRIDQAGVRLAALLNKLYS